LARIETALAKEDSPAARELTATIRAAAATGNYAMLHAALEPHLLLNVTVSPESRVKVDRGPAEVSLIANQPRLALIKITNQSGGQQRLTAASAYAGAAQNPFAIEVLNRGELTADLTGVLEEYRLLSITCAQPGKRELTIRFDAGLGTQDLGFRGETPVLFEVQPR